VLSDRYRPTKLWQVINEYKASYFNSIGGMMQILDAAFKPVDVPQHTAHPEANSEAKFYGS